jgi:hypothetical protein
MWITKLKTNLLHLYPELSRLKHFQELPLVDSIKINPKTRLILRYLFPIVILFFVIFTGLTLGQALARLLGSTAVNITPPESISPTPETIYISPIEPLKSEIESFSLDTFDPLQPSLDYNITLEATKK